MKPYEIIVEDRATRKTRQVIIHSNLDLDRISQNIFMNIKKWYVK